MLRLKKESDLNTMNDIEVMLYYKAGYPSEQDAAIRVFLKRYTPLITRHWCMFMHECGMIYYVGMYRDDFFSEASVQMIAAANAVNMDKIYNDNWKFLGYFNWYLANLRKSFRNMAIRNMSFVRSINEDESRLNKGDISHNVEDRLDWNEDAFVYDHTSEAEALSNMECSSIEKVIQSCYNNWSDLDKHIFNRIAEGANKSKLAEELGISLYMLKKHIKCIKTEVYDLVQRGDVAV